LSVLIERLRAVVAHGALPRMEPDVADAVAAGVPSIASGSREPADLEAQLGGEWRACGGVRCFVVERRVEASVVYGRETVGALAALLRSSAQEAALIAGGARPPFLFIDLETTGLSGGAGTHAFLVGCASFDDGGAFVTRQYLLTRFADERPVLAAVATELARAGALVSFNGKSFDAPVLETRYLFHRLPWPADALPHVDVLHPARRFWRDDDVPHCSLGVLERQVLGVSRVGDVHGFEIPARYFQFIRTGNARPLGPVLEHNRLDLLSLAGLSGLMLHMLRGGPDTARHAREALALGRIYARAGLDDRARHAFELAASRLSAGPLRVEALRSLAQAWRRARHFENAASCWRALLDVRACPPAVAAEAMEALAIHHEHRVRDLETAKAFALRSRGTRRQASAALEHRLTRLELKLRRQASAPLPLLSSP
jgi:uncharacterized protein